MAENDLLAAAKGIVESYLEASMVPDPAPRGDLRRQTISR